MKKKEIKKKKAKKKSLEGRKVFSPALQSTSSEPWILDGPRKKMTIEDEELIRKLDKHLVSNKDFIKKKKDQA